MTMKKEFNFKKIEDLLNWIKKETGVNLITIEGIENNEINDIKEFQVMTDPTLGFRNYLKLLKLEKELGGLIEFYNNNDTIKIVLNY